MLALFLGNMKTIRFTSVFANSEQLHYRSVLILSRLLFWPSVPTLYLYCHLKRKSWKNKYSLTVWMAIYFCQCFIKDPHLLICSPEVFFKEFWLVKKTKTKQKTNTYSDYLVETPQKPSAWDTVRLVSADQNVL